jgi:hypothetical protein
MFRRFCSFGVTALLFAIGLSCPAQPAQGKAATAQSFVSFDRKAGEEQFALAENDRIVPIYVAQENPETVKIAAKAFACDLEKVTGGHAQILSSLKASPPNEVLIAGVIGRSPEIDRMRREGKLQTAAIDGKWESAITAVVTNPMPGVRRALVIAASDRRGAAFALFTISRQAGVSPWTWWADVPVMKHRAIYVNAAQHIQGEPSVQYRGIFLNDEDWGLRPWAAKRMDPDVNNIGPHTYARVFELLLRLHANTLWPAMHPGTLPFNALPENAKQADRWGIVMGASHSEALLRNNVGEWDEKRDGPWNYQTNSAAINRYWDTRLAENSQYENLYTVGMRGVHDSGLEATGTSEEKARLVEQVMTSQRELLRKHIKVETQSIPQVMWLYKESLELYRAGMRVPDDVMLGWTDDNYGYLRQLPAEAEQKRTGGSAVYYHVSYWGFPHDYLWLCTTPPALIQEEMTKAFDHNARRFWILNVGDIKPAEADIDYFLQLAWDEPRVAQVNQHSFLESWSAEQFPPAFAHAIADKMQRYYQLNFVRKPEHMGFNGYDDGIRRTDFNPLAWGDQNHTRDEAWRKLSEDTAALASQLPSEYSDAFFELVAYPVEAAAAQNEKFLAADRSFLDESLLDDDAAKLDAKRAQNAYDRVQSLTAHYNALANEKWNGMMSSAPRNREVFKMPRTASYSDAKTPLPSSWRAFTMNVAIGKVDNGKAAIFEEQNATVSINAAHFTRKSDGKDSFWKILPELGISGASVVYGSPGLLANAASTTAPTIADAPWLEYEFQTVNTGKATLTLSLLPTFPVDSQHKLRYAVALDGHEPVMMDESGSGEWQENAAPTWETNVLRNAARMSLSLNEIPAGHHRIRLIYQNPGVIFEHLVIAFQGASPAYPVPPETMR